MDDNKKRVKVNGTDVSRRSFITKAVAGAGATAAVMLAKSEALAAEAPAGNPIKIPDTFAALGKAKATEAKFPMRGTDLFAQACKDEGLAALFCCPGNYGIVSAIGQQGIPVYSGRNEGSMAHAADGFCRVTGEVAACSGTEGPGFTSMLHAIATANSARSPILVLASNMSMGNEDSEQGIQLIYQQPLTEGIKKYGKRMINPKRIHEYAGYAFRKLKSGVPRPVHLDFPSEISGARFTTAEDVEYYYSKDKYRTTSKPNPDPKALREAVALLDKAERPIIVSSNGVFYSKGWDALKKLAEKASIPVAESGVVKGQIAHDSPLSANASSTAYRSADVVVLVGQYCMPNVREFAFSPDAKYIRIDPDPEDIGRNMPIDVGIVSCERAALEALADALPAKKRDSWLSEIAAAKKQFEEQNDEHYKQGVAIKDAVHPSVIATELANFMYRGKIPKEQTTFVVGGYGIGRYVRRRMQGHRPGQILNGAYQFGAIGPDVGYAFGAAAAMRHGIGPQAPYKGSPVIAVTGDAGIGYTIMELETASKYKMPMVVVVYNNNAWGTWTQGGSDPTTLQVHLFQENVRYDKVAEGLGAHGEYVTTPEGFRPALERCFELAVKESRPSLINCQARKEFWSRGANNGPGFLQQKTEPGYMAYSH